VRATDAVIPAPLIRFAASPAEETPGFEGTTVALGKSAVDIIACPRQARAVLLYSHKGNWL
jgi:hypothetical protein